MKTPPKDLMEITVTSGSAEQREGISVLDAARAAREGRAVACEWRLPSGQDLISFALAAGLAAGPLAPDLDGRAVVAESGAAARRGRGRKR